ncbi:MAG: hypothetical protein GF417_02910 [Candidatus Latescibacteria bacterium]|nr:hypothetical protein [bacterium]MBD3423378.1 hypothetical protein [Candidatus Latescibacterota bacterium]
MTERICISSLTFCLLAIIFLFSAPSPAGENGEDECRNHLEPGSWSVQFQIADDINLRPFNGKVISLKYHFSEKRPFAWA